MKLTRYGQSCILIESEGKRILIDPGYMNLTDSIIDKDWMNIDAIFVSHKHRDHIDENAVVKIIKSSNPVVYTSKEVSKEFSKINFKSIKVGTKISIGKINVEVVDSIHGYMPLMRGPMEINENLGFIITEGKNRVYFTGDTIGFKNDYKCDVIIVPVSGNGPVLGSFEAALFSKATDAKIAIPVHYDNPMFNVNLDEVKQDFEKVGVKCKILDIGQSLEL